MGERLWIACAVLCPLLLAPAGAQEQEEVMKPPDMPPVQRPADPAAVHAQMDQMKAAADAIIAEAKAELAKKETPAVELFIRHEGRIHLAMWPAFGPANAWLFNERGAKVGALAEALGMAGDAPPFETYARLILAAAGSTADLGPFVDREAGLDLRFQKHVDGRLKHEQCIGPIKAEGLQTVVKLVEVRAWLGDAASGKAKPEIDADRKRVRIPRAAGDIQLVFQWMDRWVLTDVLVES